MNDLATHPDLVIAARLAVAALAGLAVGIEREWSGREEGPERRRAGARTFFLLGLLGGIVGWFWADGAGVLAAVLLAAGTAFLITSHLVFSARETRKGGATTQAAALVVLGLGTAAGLGQLALAGGVTAVVVLALGEKDRIRAFVERIGEGEMRGALQFAVLALVILPILPLGPYGPFGGFRPRFLWAVVLLFSGLNFAVYLTRRAVGRTRGYAVAGLLGGLVSSTLVTLNFSRQSRLERDAERALAVGAIGACVVLLPRVIVLGLILNAAVGLALLPYLAPPLLLGVGILLVATRGRAEPPGPDTPEDLRNPLRLWSAMKLALAFQAVLMIVDGVRDVFGAPGVLGSSALLGLTSLDALTLSMARLGGLPNTVRVAAAGIAIGVLANTVFKLLLVMALGSAGFRRRASVGLAGLAAASGLGLWVGSLVLGRVL